MPPLHKNINNYLNKGLVTYKFHYHFPMKGIDLFSIHLLNIFTEECGCSYGNISTSIVITRSIKRRQYHINLVTIQRAKLKGAHECSKSLYLVNT
jgi:hypothetical protein